jgi:hypothetical protein
MNSYDDVVRRVYFMLNEIGRLGHDYHHYRLVVSRRLYADLVRDMDETTRAAHRFKPAELLGFPLHLYDGRVEYYLALVHEVQG